MRISTAFIYQAGGDTINRQQAELFATQQRISSGQRLLAPADDPVAATQALAVTAAKAHSTQLDTNVSTARDALGADEGVLAQVTDVLQSIRTLAVNGGAGTLNNADRASLADDIAGRLAELVGLANSKGGDGAYLFAGFAANTQPFVQTPAGVVYEGDQGQRELAVGTGRSMPISEHGSTVFEQGRTGNGTFATVPGAANSGTGVIDVGSIVDPAVLTGDAYRLVFAAGGTQYDVVDTTTGTTVSAGNTFTAGAAIALPGMQVTIAGAPAAGDTFDVTPSIRQSVFATIEDLVATLRTSGDTAAGRARIANGIGAALANLDQGLGNVLTVRAGLGARLRELDSLAAGNEGAMMQYDQTLSRLVDLDYNRALSDFAQQQVALEAAQKSFVKISGLSLFSYL